MKTAKLCSVLFLALVLVLFVGPARATVTLTSGNSTALINPASSAGMYSWTVDGVSEMYQQWFWYSIGTGVDASIDTLGLLSSTAASASVANLDYGSATAGLEVDITYVMVGGSAGSHNADISETIDLINHTTGPMSLHFFQYTDFDLCGTPAGQSVTITGTPANTATQTSACGIMSETSITNYPNEYEAAGFSTIVDSLNGGTAFRLTNNATYGPGDATFAFEWDPIIAAGRSFIISKDKGIMPNVPEPATIFGLGAILLAVGRKLRSRLSV